MSSSPRKKHSVYDTRTPKIMRGLRTTLLTGLKGPPARNHVPWNHDLTIRNHDLTIRNHDLMIRDHDLMILES